MNPFLAPFRQCIFFISQTSPKLPPESLTVPFNVWNLAARFDSLFCDSTTDWDFSFLSIFGIFLWQRTPFCVLQLFWTHLNSRTDILYSSFVNIPKYYRPFHPYNRFSEKLSIKILWAPIQFFKHQGMLEIDFWKTHPCLNYFSRNRSSSRSEL